jgi:predicted ester cyclase
MKNILAFLGAALLLSGCMGGNRDLVSTAKQLDVLANAHNVDGFAAQLADDVVLKAPDGTIYKGKDAVKGWLNSMFTGFHVESRGYQQSGDTVSWMSTINANAFTAMGVSQVKANTFAVFAGDKVRYFEGALDRETAGKMAMLKFYAEVINGGNVDAVEKYVAADMVEHVPLPPGAPTGVEGVKGYFKMTREAFPDLHATPTVVMAEGDLVTVAATFEGTNKGKFMGKPATNKKIMWTGSDIIRLVNGKAVEHWGWDDMADRMAHSR